MLGGQVRIFYLPKPTIVEEKFLILLYERLVEMLLKTMAMFFGDVV